MAKQEPMTVEGWPERPWIMAAVGAVAGFLFFLLVDGLRYDLPITTAHLLRQSAAAGLAVAALSFIITADRLRWTWALVFALGWGLTIALVGYSTGAYGRSGELMGVPFLSGLLAVGIAGPLFQTMRDEGRRVLPYDKVHRYAWTDAIIGGASFAFTGLTFLVAFLLAALFDAIGISLLKDLLNEGLFDWAMAGAAFGAVSAVLRERDPLLGTLQRLVMLVFSVLAPVLAFALAVYLVALPVTGFGGLWKSGLPETPLLLSAAGLAFVFLNAIIGDSSEERGKGRLWRVTETILLLAVLPLGLLALVSMGMRVGQYGWTPERLWGVTACLIAIAFGIANVLALWRGRSDFDAPVRTYQKRLAVGLCGLALLLALPIVDFGAISAQSQMNRLAAGKAKVDEFDWQAMAFDFGPAGRKRLSQIAREGGSQQRALAKAALANNDRYDVARVVEKQAATVSLDQRLRILPEGATLPVGLRDAIVDKSLCTHNDCVTILTAPDRAVLGGKWAGMDQLQSMVLVREANGNWTGAEELRLRTEAEARVAGVAPTADISAAQVEIRPVERRQLFIDGKPVGQPFE